MTAMEVTGAAELGISELTDVLASWAQTLEGRALCREAGPLDGQEAAIAQLELVDQLMMADEALAVIFPDTEGYRPALEQSTKGIVLSPEQLENVAKIARSLARQIAKISALSDDFAGLFASARVGHGVCQSIEQCIDAAEIRDNATPALAKARKAHRRAIARRDDKAKRLLRAAQDAGQLQDEFATDRDGRTVLPVKAASHKRIGGIVHGTSQSGQTWFMEPPSLIPLNNDVAVSASAVAEEERRILTDLSAQLGAEAESLFENLALAARLDFLWAARSMGRAFQGCIPTFAHSEYIFEQLGHPKLKIVGECVTNTVRFKPGQCSVISGPNAGGKTVLLKSLGLAVWLGHAGLPVCCASAQIVWRERLSAVVGDGQDIGASLSTFSAHVTSLAHVIAISDELSFVLVDEIAGATSPEQGAALAQAILEYWCKQGTTVVASTHYDQIKLWADQHEKAENWAAVFDMDTLLPTFEVIAGHPGQSGGIAIAKRLGIGTPIVSRAEELLSPGEMAREHSLQDIDEARLILAKQSRELETVKAELEKDKKRLSDREDKLRGKASRYLSSEQQAVQEELRVLRDELDKIRVRIRKGKTDGARQELSRVAKQAFSPLPDTKDVRPGLASVSVGETVFVPHMGREGQVTDVSGDTVTVLVGKLRVVSKLKDLKVGHEQAGKPTRSIQAPSPKDHTVGELDLRGHRVEDGLRALEDAVDQALLSGYDSLTVYHGEGTGALRQAVRAWAKRSKAIDSWQDSQDDLGRDTKTELLFA